MPNATARNARKGRGKAGKANDKENTEMTASASEVADKAAEQEEQDPAVLYGFEVGPAPADYEPNRKTPGRIRRPSFFDDVLKDPNVFEKGWQRVPVTSDEHKAAVLRELNRSKLFLGVGLELDTDNEDDDAIYFKSRTLQKRERKAAKDAAVEAGEADPSAEGDDDSEDDNE